MTRPILKPFQSITNGAMSTNLTSSVTLIPTTSLVTYIYSWSGTAPVGTLKVQVSNDYTRDVQGNVSNAGNWADISFLAGSATASSLAVTGATGTAVINLPLCGAYAIRTTYTVTSGSGTIQAYICGKAS